MRRAALLLVVALLPLALAAARKPATRSYRLVQPWSKLTSLTPDQQAQIYEIHKRTLEETRKLLSRERREILALLSDQQKIELAELTDGESVRSKLDSAAQRQPQTQPASTEPAAP